MSLQSPRAKITRRQRINTHYARLIGMLFLCCLLLALAPPARAQTATPRLTLTVDNSSGDASTQGSLPYLLAQANATSTPTTILFDSTLDGSTITPALPQRLSRDIHLLAQDAGGSAIDITLDGSLAPTNDFISIAFPNATIRGFNIVNFASRTIHVESFTNCQANARVTISDNVLTATSSSSTGIYLSPNAGCAAVTISGNRIETPGSSAHGLLMSKSLSGLTSSSLDLTVSNNTFTAGQHGIYLAHSHNNTATSTAALILSNNTITGGLRSSGISIIQSFTGGGVPPGDTPIDLAINNRTTATLSGNRIAGANTGIHINNTTGPGNNSEVDATLSQNRVTGATTFGIRINLEGTGGRNTVTVNGTGNIVTGSGTLDLYAQYLGTNARASGRGGFGLSGHLANTFFNTRNIYPGEDFNRFTLAKYRVAQRQRPPFRPVWLSHHWPRNLIVSRYKAARFLSGGSGISIEEEYRPTFRQGDGSHLEAIAFSVVSGQTTPPDSGAIPVAVKLLFRDSVNFVVNLDTTHILQVCLPRPSDLSGVPALQLAWLDGTTWYPLISYSYRGGSQICADIVGFPNFFVLTRPESPPTAPGSRRPAPTQPPLDGVLENPAAGSFRSGIGLISGWTCATGVIEVEINGTHLLEAASGTSREDVATAGRCGGRADVGFGVLFNWNLIGDGTHTMRALADGVEFDRATFTVTTLGEEFIWGARGETIVSDFPSPGEQVRLVWQEGLQNFRLVPLSAAAAPPPAEQAPRPGTGPRGFLENPVISSVSQSGISVISGWTCATGVIEVEIDGIYLLEAASGTSRKDVATAGQCGGRADVGFGVLFNWNLIGDGTHTVRVLADGVEFDRATFTVTTLGEEFIRGASGQAVVADFPSAGQTVTLTWQESVQNFVITNLE